MLLSLVTHVPGPTWRPALSPLSAMAGGKSTYLERGREEGARGGRCERGGGGGGVRRETNLDKQTVPCSQRTTKSEGPRLANGWRE